MKIRKGSELENMSNITDDRLTLLNVALQKPVNNKQKFIQRRIHTEIAKRCREAVYVDT